MKFIADRLKSARSMNGFSLQGLANELSEIGNPISKQALSMYEQGKTIPNSEVLGFLSKVLNVTPEYFYNDTLVEFGEIEFRKLKSYSNKESNRIVEISRDSLRRYLELEEILGIKTAFENPIANEEITDLLSVDKAADKLRSKWKLGTNPIPNTIELLENHHIKVLEIESGVKLDGFSTLVNEKYPIVVLNTTKLEGYTDRKRWTAIHELGHQLLNLNHLDKKGKERYCHYFAGALLFPREAIIRELGENRSRISFGELKALKKEYGVSMQAIVYRAKDIGIISENYFRQFFFMFNQLGYKSNEPEQYEGYEGSGRFSQLLSKAVAEGVISMSKAASLNNQKLARFREENFLI